MRLDSLAFRLFATAALWTLVALPLAGFIILSLYRQEVDGSFDERIKTLLLVVYTDSSDHAQRRARRAARCRRAAVRDHAFRLVLADQADRGRAGPPHAGLQVARQRDAGLAAARAMCRPMHSASAGRTATGPNGAPLRVAEMIQALGGDESGPRYSYLVAGPLDWPQARITGFRTRLFIALALVGFGLMALTLFQVRFGLLPLREIEKGLSAIRTGAGAAARRQAAAGDRAAAGRDQRADPVQPGHHRARAHPGRQSRARPEDAAGRDHQRGARGQGAVRRQGRASRRR